MSIFEYDEEKEMRLMREAEQKQIQQRTELCIRNLMGTMKFNLDQAMDALKIPVEEQAVYASRIQKL